MAGRLSWAQVYIAHRIPRVHCYMAGEDISEGSSIAGVGYCLCHVAEYDRHLGQICGSHDGSWNHPVMDM